MKVIKEVVKVKDLKELGKNPRRISDRKLKQLTKSLDGFNQMLDINEIVIDEGNDCLLYTSPSPRDRTRSRMPSSA